MPTELKHRRIPEQVVEGQRLGRHVLHDARSLDYPARRAKELKDVVHPAVGLPLDQGNLGSCTANALCGALNSQPDQRGRTFAEPDAVKLYEVETQLEGDPYPPNDPGGSGLMVCRAAKQLGWLKFYRHAFGLDHALHSLVIRPQIWGVNWYEGFDRPEVTGRVQIAGEIRGGHEIVADELKVEEKLVGFWNSWGPEYGLGGRFYVPFDVLERLLAEDGDVTVPYPVD